MATQADREQLTGVKNEYQYDFVDDVQPVFKPERGLSHGLIDQMSDQKGEPDWMRQFRHEALDIFWSKPVPTWGPDLSGIDYDDIYYYLRPMEQQGTSWDDVPDSIKNTFERLGIPEAERKFLAGVGAQYDSEMVYHSLRKEWQRLGVIFEDIDTGLREYEDLFREYFATVIPVADNKYAALNSAVWSGGSFVYVPKGVHVDIPLQAYFRINAENIGQFERTIIIVDEGASVHYVEGCTAPIYSTTSLHSGVIEIVVKKGARCRYTTIQNWSTDIYNLVTQRSIVEEDATMEWVDGNLGSKVTMKYPSAHLLEAGARAEALAIAFAGRGQTLDAGAKMLHAAPHTSSIIRSKSVTKDGGRASYRGHIHVLPGAIGSASRAECDALLLDDHSRSDTYPYMDVEESDVAVQHEATVSKVGEEQLFYLMSRGLSEEQAVALAVSGFIEPIAKELPLQYALTLNRLIALQMEGSIG